MPSMLLPLLALALAPPVSGYTVLATNPTAGPLCKVQFLVVDAESGKLLPVRVIATDLDGNHLDGAGRGLYRDGRFFADGQFAVSAPAGTTRFEISHGPHYVPLTVALDLAPRTETQVQVKLAASFSPAELGWYGGDNHVHAQHDAEAAVRTDLRFAALQGRANGLNFITEAGSNVSYDELDKLDTPTFLLRKAQEIRPGPYVGHLNTPGIAAAIPGDVYQRLVQRALPAQAVFAAVRERGGSVTHTHPMTPRHQLHWMGAAEAYSDAVAGNCANLFDVDSVYTQQMWFALLNLGNKIGVSSYTDCALGRVNTPAPGDRRVYCRAEHFDYRSIVDAMRGGRTMATNGGPVFVFLSVGDAQPGDTLPVDDAGKPAHASLRVESRHKLRSVELYQQGERVATLDARGRQGSLRLKSDVAIPGDRFSWLVARAEDEQGNWCLTSPIYFEPAGGKQSEEGENRGAALLLEISNASRFATLRPAYFAHLIVTVRPQQRLTEVELRKDGQPVQVYRPADGDQIVEGQIPVTGIEGDYAAGRIWHPQPEQAWHFQADCPVTASGWYSLHAKTAAGDVLVSDSLLYEAGNPASQTVSAVKLTGPQTYLSLWGYGEDAPVADLKPPYDQGGWWYPQQGYSRQVTRFGKQEKTLGWPNEQPVERFRPAK